jgi:hypothetical protein
MALVLIDSQVDVDPGVISGFQPYIHTYSAIPPEDPLGWVGVENNPELQWVPVGVPITVVGNDPGLLPGTWTGVVTRSDEHWIGFTPDTTEYLGDNSAAWDDYLYFGDCQVLTYRYDAIFINWNTKVIYVPKNFLTFVSGTTYEMDTDAFRLALKDIEDDEGIPFLDTHRHNTEVALGGLTYARTIEIINGYTVYFEDGMYAVNLIGSNNNIADVAIVNHVSIRPTNSAGLVSNATPQDISQAVWDEELAGHTTSGTTGRRLKDILPTLWGIK